MKKLNKKGFTLVELVIVIAVIAILASVLIPTFSNMIAKANMNAALQEARNCYTEWNSEALADDGFISNDELTQTEQDGYAGTFVITGEDGAVTTFEYTTNKGYVATYTVADGEWEVEAPAN